VVSRKTPVYVEENFDIEKVKDIMVNKKIGAIPVVDKKKVICDVLFWEDILGQDYKKKKAEISVPVVIMAGGKGARMSFLEKIFPKPLIPVGEKPVIELVMDSFYENGCSDFYLLLHHKAEVVRSYFNSIKTDYNIKFIDEKKPLGTAGGLKLLPKSFAETFFLSNCDILIKEDYEDMFNFHKSCKNDITVVVSYKHFPVPYGVIEIDEKSKDEGKLKRIVEKPEHDHLVIVGMYIIEKKIIKLIPPDKSFNMPDLLRKAKDHHMKVGVYPINEKSWIDIGELEKYKEVIKKFEL
jgi:NDP-sugar pyrophosphorylase family protein